MVRYAKLASVAWNLDSGATYNMSTLMHWINTSLVKVSSGTVEDAFDVVLDEVINSKGYNIDILANV